MLGWPPRYGQRKQAAWASGDGVKGLAPAQEETRRIIEAWEQVRKQARPGA
ncbi:hypothetical protein D187_005054 [Cystobacter fuscus DSM 2262]|uniref:Uncharacterized protein n=1 Tax=Cystobacter fuscus (strain ATCC 25194 / DSM 2262 / NBRC 100088 / M29) TaxID=1242864 RepID=S9PLL5_CYSF2|nr:hypothetical protein [Cystobacter fuscus]EPX63921.1 hypothetical protein D187_005054 [Cystobacter fuscus DSM 2262]